MTLSAVAPDIDGLGLVADFLTHGTEGPLYWWFHLHHTMGHNLGFALVVTGAVYCLAVRRPVTACLALVSFHTHLLGDILGSRGPGSHEWAIPYLAPFSDKLQIFWQGQWELNAWPNIAITLILLTVTFCLAWRRGFAPVELISRRADCAFVKTLRARFGSPKRNPDQELGGSGADAA